MAYNTVAIRKDVEGKPTPQYYNPISNQYEPLEGFKGANKIILFDTAGNAVDIVALVASIVAEIAKPVKLDGSTMEYYGKVADPKPTINVIKGSTYFEIDTKKVYMWDGTGWVVI